ncbi:putative invasin [Xenorhabdus beddingii]|uniref:Putative invasin n=1 Tax=Xenorhabdus beddingii TaxID=40578 RepID=A0A1Y2SIV7_9GAMM|nr:putative invasin [Xenorhabdus beddingii]
MIIKVTDPDGKGVKTTLKVTAEGASGSKNQDVIFTVLTSPDTNKANYWGHMPNFIKIDGVTFNRPQLKAEFSGYGASPEWHNEIWVLIAHGHTDDEPTGALLYCANQGKSLPTRGQLQKLQSTYGHNGVQTKLGWPTNEVYYDNYITSDRFREAVSLVDGSYEMTHFGHRVSCIN